jgi:hypothetical protein
MGSYRVQLPSTGTLEEAFARMPARVKDFVRAGLNVLTKLPENNLDLLLKVVLETIQSGESLSDVSHVTRLGVPQEDAPALIGSMSLLASLASGRAETAEQFVSSAVDSKLLEATHVGTARMFFNAVVQNRQAFKRAFDASRLSTRGLPSLTDFETTVDIRFGFEKGQLSESIAVVLLHIDTDAYGHEIWLQLTKVQLERMIRDLEETLKNVERAEKAVERSASNQ